MNSLTFARVLYRMGACLVAVDFVKHCWRSGLRSAEEVWCVCENAAWKQRLLKKAKELGIK